MVHGEKRPKPNIKIHCGGDKAKSCAFTGYRPEKFSFRTNEGSDKCRLLKQRICAEIRKLIDDGYTHFICGGAQGADTYAAEAVISLREIYPEITLEIAVPFPDQAKEWRLGDRERYLTVLSFADTVTMCQNEYSQTCYFNRNRYLVNHASTVIAIYNGKRGGTQMTVDYAKRMNRNIIVIDPEGGNYS